MDQRETIKVGDQVEDSKVAKRIGVIIDQNKQITVQCAVADVKNEALTRCTKLDTVDDIISKRRQLRSTAQNADNRKRKGIIMSMLTY